MTTPTPRIAEDDDRRSNLELESLEVWPDELRIGDRYGGYVITAIAQADHYRSPAVRLTIWTDPDFLEQGVKSEEFGRIVLMTDRQRGHKIPIDRPIR